MKTGKRKVQKTVIRHGRGRTRRRRLEAPPARTRRGRGKLAVLAVLSAVILPGCAQFQPPSEGSLVPAELTATQTQPQAQQVEGRLARLDQQVSMLAFQIEATRQAVAQTQAAVAELKAWQTRMEETFAQLPELRKQMDGASGTLAALNRRVATLEQELAGERRTIATLKSTLAGRGTAPRYGLHIADYPDAATAAAAWVALKDQLHENVNGLHAIVKPVSGGPENPEFVQLVVGPFASAQEAQARCNAIRKITTLCEVVDFSGRRLPGENGP